MNICSIIATNYLAQARELAASFRRHHPDGRCYVLVIDEPDGYVDVGDEDFVLVRPSEIGIDAFERMRTTYSVLELSTALKPWMLRFMLDHHDDGSGVAYLDPDIQIHSRMVELEAALREHAVVLTPHVLRGMPRDGKRPNETDILMAGIYNLGFIGMSRRPDAHTVIEWWAERLLTDCFVAPDRGYFVDQRWVDFVPGLIDDLKILRDPGYNVAYWNLPERRLELRADEYWAGGRPLRFFHFSGYDPARRSALSRHQTRIELTEDELLLELCNAYADALEARGHHVLAALPYSHDTLPSGLKLTRAMRTLYRRATEQKEVSLGSPFTADGEADFLVWLAGPADEAPGLNRFAHEVWAERADLQREFPGVPAGDLDGYLDWLAANGSEQIDAPADLLAPAEELPAPAVPRAEPAAASPPEKTGVPEAAAPPVRAPIRPSGVNVVGYLRSEVGVGEVARQLIGAFDAAGVTATATNVPAPNSRQRHRYSASNRPQNPFPVNLLCINADMLPEFAADVGESFFADRYTIGVWWWETDRFPEMYHSSFDLLDEVWVGSRFIAEALRPVSPVPVIHMPMPIVFPEATRFDAGEQGWPDAFTFLFSWDYNSVFERKNPLAVVEAYIAAFEPDDGAALVLKSVNHHRDPANHRRLADAVADRPDIVIMDEYLDARDKDRLMCSCDCYVSLHRSEGLGLTIAEALFYARPVIATGYSGNLELMDGSNSHPVGYGLVPIGEDAAPYPAQGMWAEPDVAEASRLMRQVFEHPEDSAPRAAKAARDMRERHSARAAGAAMRRRLVDIAPRTPGDSLADGAPILPTTSSVHDVWRLLDLRGRVRDPSRFGLPGTVARRLAHRVMRPYTAYQLELNEALGRAVASLHEHTEALAESVEVAAVQTELDLAESQAVLAAQIRQQQRELADLPRRDPTSDGSHPESVFRVATGDRSSR